MCTSLNHDCIRNKWRSPRGIMAKVLDCGLEVSGFQLQSSYYVHFRTNDLSKDMKLLIPQL